MIKTCASYSTRTVQKGKRTRSLLKVHLLQSLKHALLFQSALYKKAKNAFFTKSALVTITKTCASSSKRTVKNCKRTRSLLKVHLLQSLKHALLLQKRTVQNCKRTRSLLKVHLLQSLKHALLIQSALYKMVKERLLY